MNLLDKERPFLAPKKRSRALNSFLGYVEDSRGPVAPPKFTRGLSKNVPGLGEQAQLERLEILWHQHNLTHAIPANLLHKLFERSRRRYIQCCIRLAAMAVAAGNERKIKPACQFHHGAVFRMRSKTIDLQRVDQFSVLFDEAN